MKILQIVPELNEGGVERGTLELARHLAAHGHESLVVSHGGRLVAALEAGGSTHIRRTVHRKSPLSLLRIPALRRLFLTESPDIVHARSRVPAWLAWLAWRTMDPGTRPRFVTTVHGLHSVNAYSRIMTRGERVIAVSECAKDYVLDNYLGLDPAVVRVVPRGIDPAEFPPGYQPPAAWLDTWRREHPGVAGKFVLTLPARLTRLKGHEEFVWLVSTLKDNGVPVHGLIVGGTHPKKRDYAAGLAELVEDTGLGNDVTFLGHRADLREIMAVSQAVLSLSKQPESFGRVVLEALAMGKPVVGFDHGGVAELLRHFLPEGAVDPGDLRAAAGLLSSWHRDGAPVPAKENPYTLQAMLDGTLAVYRELVVSSSASKRSSTSEV